VCAFIITTWLHGRAVDWAASWVVVEVSWVGCCVLRVEQCAAIAHSSEPAEGNVRQGDPNPTSPE